jgi:protein ImuB
MARLRALMGHDRCGTPRLRDTHRPGAFTMADEAPAPDRATPRRTATATATTEIAGLLSGATAIGAPIGRGVRRIRHPIPARVSVEHGRPVRVVTDRRGWSGGRVLWCCGPWRASGEWWTDAAYRWQEWDVTLGDGGQYRIHEDRQLARWFINAIWD